MISIALPHRNKAHWDVQLDTAILQIVAATNATTALLGGAPDLAVTLPNYDAPGWGDTLNTALNTIVARVNLNTEIASRSPILTLGPSAPIPAGTPAGTVIVRTTT